MASSFSLRVHSLIKTSKASPPSILKGASLLIILSLVSRLVTFAANQLLLRYLTAPLLGLSAQLEVYYLSVLFFARESLRVAIQRQGLLDSRNSSSSSSRSVQSQNEREGTRMLAGDSQAVLNLGYLSIAIGINVAIALGYAYLRYSDVATLASTPYLHTSLYIYGLAAILELLSEPCFVLMQTRLDFSTRARAESSATFFRCAVVYCSAVIASRQRVEIGVLPFALGQITYGSVIFLVYLYSGWKLSSRLHISLLLSPIQGTESGKLLMAGLFYRPTITLAGSMMAQSLVKHLLTQGDTFLISLLSTPEVQGVYALANNYGSLLARLLLQPVEESSRSYFSRLLASSSSLSTGPDAAEVSKDEMTQKDADKNKPAFTPVVLQVEQNLHTLLRIYLLLSLPIAVFGPPASPHLLRIVAGSHWATSASPVLALYALYVPVLALNGLTEAFVASVATEADIHAQSGYMFLFTLLFAGAASIFMGRLGLGARGLVMANSVNMCCRIAWSWQFMSRWFARRKVEFRGMSCVPVAGFVLSVATAGAMRWIESQETKSSNELNSFKALLKLGATGALFLITLAFLERHFLATVFASLTSNHKT